MLRSSTRGAEASHRGLHDRARALIPVCSLRPKLSTLSLSVKSSAASSSTSSRQCHAKSNEQDPADLNYLDYREEDGSRNELKRTEQNPTIINQEKIRRVNTLEQLCHLVLHDGESFRGANATFALSRMAKLYMSAIGQTQQLTPGEGGIAQNPGIIPTGMVETTLQALDRIVMSKSAAFDMWDVSLALWAYSRMGYYNRAVFECVCRRGIRLMESRLEPVDCAQLMTAFGHFGHYHTALLSRIPLAMLNQLDRCKPHELSQVMWGFAKLGIISPKVKVFCEATMDLVLFNIDQFGCQELVILLWSLSRLLHVPTLRFMQLVETSLLRMLPYLSPQDFANAIYSFVKMRYKPANLMDAASAHMAIILYDFKPNELSQVLYGYTQSRHYHKALLNVIAPVLATRLLEMSPQDLSIAFWSYGIFLHRPPTWQGSREMLNYLLVELQHRQPGVFEQLLQLDRSASLEPSPLLEMFCIAALTRVRFFKPQQMGVIMKAFGRLYCHPKHPLVAEIAAAAEEQIERFRPDDVSSLLFGLSSVAYSDMRIYYACVRHLIRIMETPEHKFADKQWMNYYVLNSIVKSCRRVGYTPWTLLDLAESRGIPLSHIPDPLKSFDQTTSPSPSSPFSSPTLLTQIDQAFPSASGSPSEQRYSPSSPSSPAYAYSRPPLPSSPSFPTRLTRGDEAFPSASGSPLAQRSSASSPSSSTYPYPPTPMPPLPFSSSPTSSSFSPSSPAPVPSSSSSSSYLFALFLLSGTTTSGMPGASGSPGASSSDMPGYSDTPGASTSGSPGASSFGTPGYSGMPGASTSGSPGTAGTPGTSTSGSKGESISLGESGAARQFPSTSSTSSTITPSMQPAGNGAMHPAASNTTSDHSSNSSGSSTSSRGTHTSRSSTSDPSSNSSSSSDMPSNGSSTTSGPSSDRGSSSSSSSFPSSSSGGMPGSRGTSSTSSDPSPSSGGMPSSIIPAYPPTSSSSSIPAVFPTSRNADSSSSNSASRTAPYTSPTPTAPYFLGPSTPSPTAPTAPTPTAAYPSPSSTARSTSSSPSDPSSFCSSASSLREPTSSASTSSSSTSSTGPSTAGTATHGDDPHWDQMLRIGDVASASDNLAASLSDPWQIDDSAGAELANTSATSAFDSLAAERQAQLARQVTLTSQWIDWDKPHRRKKKASAKKKAQKKADRRNEGPPDNMAAATES